MKMKHVFWLISAIVAVIAMAAGVAVLVNRFVGPKADAYDYIECDCEPEEE